MALLADIIKRETGVVSYWRQNDPSGVDMLDSYGVMPGAYVGGPTLGYSGPLSGDPSSGAVLFDGSTQYAVVDDFLHLNFTDQVTIEALVFQSQSYGPTSQTSQLFPSPDLYPSSMLYPLGPEPHEYVAAKEGQYALLLQGSQPAMTVWVEGSSRICTSPDPIVGGWRHIIGTYDGKLLDISVDGEEQGRMSVSGSMDVTDNDFVVAGSYSPTDPTLDTFTTDSIGAGTYTFDAGAGTIAVSGNQLVPSSTSEKRFYRAGSTYSDVQLTHKLVTGASVAGFWGIGHVLRRLNATDYLLADLGVQGASTSLVIYKAVGGTFTPLATSSFFTPSTGTAYWLQSRANGDDIEVDLWNSEPTPTGNPIKTVPHTLTGADAATFGAGTSGNVGFRTTLVPTDYRYDDYLIEPAPTTSRLFGGLISELALYRVAMSKRRRLQHFNLIRQILPDSAHSSLFDPLSIHSA